MPDSDTRPRAVICDDDTILRTVIARVVDDAGFRVVAHSEDPEEALSQVERFDADLLVTDLALRTGSGESLIAKVHEVHPSTQVLVFSAYTDRHSGLYEAGARSVVPKPDFADLEAELAAILEHPDPDSAASDRRRRDKDPQPMPDPTAIGPGGIEPWLSFGRAIDNLRAGDAVLALDVQDAHEIEREHGHTFMSVYRYEAARLAAPVLRPHDRLALTDECQPVILLTASYPEAPTAVFQRIERSWEVNDGPGVLVGAFTHVRTNETPRRALDRCLQALADGDVDAARPLRFT